MSHSRSWDATSPLNTIKAGLVADETRKLKEDFQERMTLDHNIASGIDTSSRSADGFHKKVTMKAITTPTAIGDAGIFFVKTISGCQELVFLDGSGSEHVLTSQGKLKLFGNFRMSYVSVDSGVEAADKLDEYADGQFVPEESGYYYFRLARKYSEIVEVIDVGDYVYVNGVRNGISTDSLGLQVQPAIILRLQAGDVVTTSSVNFKIMRVA